LNSRISIKRYPFDRELDRLGATTSWINHVAIPGLMETNLDSIRSRTQVGKHARYQSAMTTNQYLVKLMSESLERARNCLAKRGAFGNYETGDKSLELVVSNSVGSVGQDVEPRA
jgi:hypothetical protein